MPIQILMPALSPTMSEGNLVKWHKKEGEVIKAGQILAEIETDKATMEIEAVDEGILGRILVAEGTENVQVNALIGLILEEGEDPAALTVESMPQAVKTKQDVALAVEEKISSPVSGVVTTASQELSESLKTASSRRITCTPLARRLAQQQGISLELIQGSGPRGRIIKADIESYENSQNTLNSSVASTRDFGGVQKESDGFLPAFQEVKLTNVRKVIAQRLTDSKKTVPHFYLTVECEIDALLKARQDINQLQEGQDKISVNDFIIKAVAIALKKVPEANVAWGEGHIKYFDQADISVAVASDTGLITPIVRNATEKSLGAISQEMKSLIIKARTGKLKPQEFQGGTFSISNLGMYGIRDFAAIVNPPQGCILAIGAGEQRPVVKDGQLCIATVMSCTLSVDHRCVDGAVGAQFLKHFKQMITHPMMMIV